MKQNKLQSLWQEIKDYLSLNIEYARMTTAEKLSVLLATVTITLLCLLVGVVILLFLSFAAAHWLSLVISLPLAYTILAAFNLLVLALIVLFRKQLIINPITKAVTRLLMR